MKCEAARLLSYGLMVIEKEKTLALRSYKSAKKVGSWDQNYILADLHFILFIIISLAPCKYVFILHQNKSTRKGRSKDGFNTGSCLNIKTVFPDMGISVIKIRWSQDHLIFIMGISILVRQHLYIETPPRLVQMFLVRQRKGYIALLCFPVKPNIRVLRARFSEITPG